ncbi:MAG TPA: penicillin-binding transpeptidase domain-containing protein [Candidatus Paceibacterota bacterium]|jgi:penicillin-binding protein 2|nr:penicillin-binding transpeptidase domain-containing protein [Candidatus Paceibacterota bacterium]
MFGRRRYRDSELNPDEIFLDASNLPEFNQNSLEGRLEKPIHRSTYFGLAFVMLLIFGALVAQAANLELVKGSTYASQSEKNRLRPDVIFAQRGAILDRTGAPLVSNVQADDGTIKRTYAAPGFGHLLGYVSYPKKDSSGNYYDTDITGLAGVEAAFNKTLSGTNGTLLVEEDALGHVQSQGSVQPAVNGQPLTLSIDARAQTAFFDAIKATADKIPFQGGAGILMNVQTGEVIAMTSYPEYDPNVLSSGGPSDVIAGYSSDPRQPYLDRPVSGLYTPGSIVKPEEAAGALTDGIITPDFTIDDTGSISVPNPYDPKHPNVFKDWEAIGVEDLRKAIGFSSDVYFYTVGGGFGGQKGLGIDRLDYWYQQFGLTTPTGIQLAGEKSGFVPTPDWKLKTFNEKWNIGDTYHTAIGQYSMQVTPIEMARAIAAVANGGTLVTPTLVKGEATPTQKVPVNAADLEVVREGMRLGATAGTSVGLNDLSFVQAAGKTGTAQLGLHNEYYNSWAVGFFPYDHPKYVYVVVMEKGPAGNGIGGIYVMHQFLTALHAAAPEYFQ